MDSMPISEIVLYTIITIIVVQNLLEIYISMRQVRVYRTALEVPKELEDFMPIETFHMARFYGLHREQFKIFKAMLEVLIICVLLYSGVIAILWKWAVQLVQRCNWDADNEIIVSLMFVALVNVICVLIEMPFKLYIIFVVEQNHGFNTQTLCAFACGQVMLLVLGQLLLMPIVAAIIFIVQSGGEHFFIWLWLFAAIVSLAMLTVFPSFIAPLFNTYRPLEPGPLRTKVENLATSLKFPLSKIYVVETSKHSSHSNAYFYGLCNSKRIVLFDTLLQNRGKPKSAETLAMEEAANKHKALFKFLEKYTDKGKGCTDDEVVAVLAHELGHWKLGHVTKNIIILQVHLLLKFAVFCYLSQYPPIYEAIGFEPGTQPILVGWVLVFVYVMAPYNALINFVMTLLSRHFEYQADEFARKLGYGELLGRALIKVNVDNLGFPVYDWLYSSWNHSHPTLLQRLDRLKKRDERDRRANRRT